MSVEDHFSEYQMTQNDVWLEDEEQVELQTMLKQLVKNLNMTNEEDVVIWEASAMDLAMFAFVAGRSYQKSQDLDPLVPITLPVKTAGKLLEMLLEGQ